MRRSAVVGELDAGDGCVREGEPRMAEPQDEAGAALSKLEAVLQGATVLDANAANELKQQQLNLKLKVKVREQKLQQRIGELEDELAAARKSVSVADLNHRLRPASQKRCRFVAGW